MQNPLGALRPSCCVPSRLRMQAGATFGILDHQAGNPDVGKPAPRGFTGHSRTASEGPAEPARRNDSEPCPIIAQQRTESKTRWPARHWAEKIGVFGHTRVRIALESVAKGSGRRALG